MDTLKKDTIKQAVRQRYAEVARSHEDQADCGCGPTCCTPEVAIGPDAAALALGYDQEALSILPEGANMGLGCGNPTAIASLKKGETVLDLGSGGGIDCFFAASEVGPSGHVIGVDMTPEMIYKAREGAVKLGLDQVEFRLGEIEQVPVADNSVDVILSNCVINLSPDKPQVFREAFRVLKPGGRLAVSDIVASAELPVAIRDDLAMYTGCVAGASTVEEMHSFMVRAGFVDIQIRPKDESRTFIREWAPGRSLEEYIVSATIEAIKPE